MALTRGALVLWLVGTAVGTVASRAEAASAVDVTWIAPPGEGCPSEASVRDAVERVVGKAGTGDGRTVRAFARVEKLGEERFRVRLQTRTGDVDGGRVLEERSCRALSEAVVVILWWMVAPDAARGEKPPDPEPEPEPEREPPLPAEPRRDVLRPNFGVLAAVDHGTMPSTALGVTARLALAWNWFQLGAYATLLPKVGYETALVDDVTVGAELSLLGVGLEGCLLFMPTPLFACAAAELDHSWGRGLGVDEPASGSATWPAIVAAGGIALPVVGSWSFEVRGGPLVPFRREQFGLDGVGVVNQPSSVGLRAGAGLSVVF